MIFLLFMLFSQGLKAPEIKLKLQFCAHCVNLQPFNDWWMFQSGMEGGYSNDKNDSGGETMRGITWFTAKNLGLSYAQFRSLTAERAKGIAYNYFWLPNAKFGSDRLNMLVTSAFWGGGGYDLVREMQKILNITQDGIIGEMTILAANEAGPELFHKLLNCRTRYLRGCWNYGYYRHGWQKSIDFLTNYE